MLKKLAAMAVLVAAVLVAPATTASADPYTPRIPTETYIEVTVRGPGEPIILHVSASANYPVPPEGDIEVQVSAGGAAGGARVAGTAPVFTTTVHFVDEPVRIEGPALQRGRYLASAALTPDDQALFLPSDDLTGFRIGADSAGGPGGPGDDADGGFLPDTGGPHLTWLLLGSGLLVAGAGSLTYARRRQTVTA